MPTAAQALLDLENRKLTDLMRKVIARRGIRGVVAALERLVDADLDKAVAIDRDSADSQRLQETVDLLVSLDHDLDCLEA